MSAEDARFDGGAPVARSGTVNANPVADPVPDSLYERARVGDRLAYAAAGLRPGRRYLVRLHFADAESARPGPRLFDVWANDRQLLDRFDVVAAAGGPRRAVVRELFVPADDRGRMRLRFVGVVGGATVSAVEVLE